MPKDSQKVKILRNLRIVAIHNEGKSFNEIARLLTSESREPISPQAVAKIYERWKDISFEFTDDNGAIIH